MRLWQTVVPVLGLAIAGLAIFVFYQIHSLKVESITDDLHVVYGLGGNAGVLATDEGTVIIDTMTLHYQGERIREVAEELTGSPVTVIINTHYHLDHTHGNPAFSAGTRVVSTARTLHHLEQTDSEYFSGKAARLKPNETFSDAMDLDMGNKTLRLVHPGRGHTDGDLVVLMIEDRTLHTGDLFFHRHYPNIDLEAGGTVQEWSETIEETMQLDFDAVIPGHGPVTDRAGFRQFQAFIRQLAQIGTWAKSEGISLEETMATDRLTHDAGYTPLKMIVPIGLNREFVLKRAWEETHGAFELRP